MLDDLGHGRAGGNDPITNCVHNYFDCIREQETQVAIVLQSIELSKAQIRAISHPARNVGLANKTKGDDY